MGKWLAEAFGTAVLVLLGCGSLVIGGYGSAFPVGILPVALSFGLAVTAMAYAIGPISGCHINPAVTLGVWSAGRMSTGDAVAYIIAQFIGGAVGAFILLTIVSGKIAGYDVAANGLGQNGWGADFLGGYGMGAALAVEVVGTFLFVFVILRATSIESLAVIAGLIIGLTLTIIHIVFVNVTGVSVNPARSFGPAIVVRGQALSQLWLFIIAPAIGGLVAGLLARATTND